MVFSITNPRKFSWCLAIALTCPWGSLPALAKPEPQGADLTARHPAVASPAPPPAMPRQHSPYRTKGNSAQASIYYQTTWGIDNLYVQRTASGNLVRFSYQVIDAERAKPLGDKQATPHLVDPVRGVMLEIPVMEKVGQLRQTGIPVAGHEYWMVFSNKGDVVKVGDRVDVVIGTFHADGLVVE